MKKLFLIPFLFLVLISQGTYANSGETLVSDSKNTTQQTPISLAEVFSFFAKLLDPQTPDSYQYISLKYTGIIPDSPLENALQILVYNDKIENAAIKFEPNIPVNKYVFESLSKKILGISVESSLTQEEQKSSLVEMSDL